MLDNEILTQLKSLKTKVRLLEGRLDVAEKANKENKQLIQQLNQKIQEAGEFSLKLAHQIQIIGS